MDRIDRLANVAWESLFRAQATLAREFEHAGDWGQLIPREYGVLYALSKARAGLRITELGDDALLSQPGISRLVARLVGRGLLERIDDADDARACRVRLTAEGRRVQRELGARHARQVAEAMTRSLGAAELEALTRLTDALREGRPPVTSPPLRSSGGER
ncbi:MarR family winged helix-turn-helix transcriptional regulator [Sinomonas sp. ASV322]|uniref:MarR family winged helix-turn-helix transcriptional regulator n=1 Tax=Sinomonas sp. ASV322 TaxID=3041920 RepID=UPI0027DE1582|nr:MarR family winged helix-turn-helix transcriptional regulator [Sinomonas sp. ASV322]MDQ4504381.1 MarR family winged helix-turn-helix transcriptional regulator [Sinomonas sp. ASV322]